MAEAEIPKKSSLFSNLFQSSNLKYVGRAIIFIAGVSLTYKAIQEKNSDDSGIGDINEIGDLFSLMSSTRQKASMKVTLLHDKILSNSRSIESSIRGPNTTKVIDKAEAALSRKVSAYYVDHF